MVYVKYKRIISRSRVFKNIHQNDNKCTHIKIKSTGNTEDFRSRIRCIPYQIRTRKLKDGCFGVLEYSYRVLS